MARKQTFSEFSRELERIAPSLADAFLAAIQDIQSSAQLTAIEAAIGRRDVEAVFTALRLGPEFFAPLDAQIRNAFEQGAIWQITQLPKKQGPAGLTLAVRFNQRNPRAEEWTRRRAGRLIEEVTNDTRIAVRETVLAGLEQGRGARKIARDLIGTTSGNQRKGGVVGLHSRDAAAVSRLRVELSDPATASRYFARTARDKRFDRTIAKAIREGRKLGASDIDRIAKRYADKLLQVRARRIARTETHAAFSGGRNEAVFQMVESGQVPAEAVTLTWQSTPGGRTRDTHRNMNGQEVKFGEAFISPRGALLMYPGDVSLGAPGSETVNCRCGARADIDFVKLAR